MLYENEFSVCFSQNSLLSKVLPVLRVFVCNIFQLFLIRFVSDILESFVTFTHLLLLKYVS